MENLMDELMKSPMMRHLLTALDQGQDIGHYGRLVFAMVARHFLPDEELIAQLTRDHDFSEEKAKSLLRQVQEHDYSPPKRDRILAWQKEQSFPICPDPEDPDACNVYKELDFPDPVYEHIEQYAEQKAGS